MEQQQSTQVRDVRLVLRVDRQLVERLNRIAAERFEGNRSFVVREAVRELLDRYEREGEAA